jgi:hypothetical protein
MTNPISSRLPIAFSSLLGVLLFAAAPAHGQAVSTSSFTIQVSGTASAVKTGLSETVQFAGPLIVTATVVNDPTLGPTVAIWVDGRGVTGSGNKTKTAYANTCVANLTRPFGPTDVIQTTFAFYQDVPGGFMNAKTGLLTLNLTYNTTTQSLTNVTASVGTM